MDTSASPVAWVNLMSCKNSIKLLNFMKCGPSIRKIFSKLNFLFFFSIFSSYFCSDKICSYIELSQCVEFLS